MPADSLPRSIEGVVEQLGEIVEDGRRDQHRTGFFAALYRQVTQRVREGIASGRFEDSGRMEQFDVAFANRYLLAWDAFRHGQPLSCSWQVAFRSCENDRLLVLQHLLLGMNAHINLDLGVAAAQTIGPGELPAFERDFREINAILGESLDDVQRRLARVSPLLGWLDRVGGRSDEAIVNFSMQAARQFAWSAAESIAPLDPAQQALTVAELDASVEALARPIRNPGRLVGLAAGVIHLFEDRDVARVIQALV